MKRYKVIEPGSSYEGKVGEELDMKEVIQRVGRGYAGRSEEWYSFWDLLLQFEGDKSGSGTGFQWHEVEEVK